MRFRLMATYRGVPYEVGVGPSSSDVVLFAACPPPEELGFEPAPGHWRKHVIRAEVNVLWESRPVGTFHGDPCLVLDDLGDRLHVAYLGKDGRRARELGYWQVNRGVYELLTPRDEVTGLTEEKVEKSLPRPAPVNGSQPMPSYPYGSPQRPPAPGGLRRPAGPARSERLRRRAALAPAGGWNGSGPPTGPGGWNRNGTPTGTGSWNRNGTPSRHRQLERPRGTAVRGRGKRARHGQLEWHGRRGWDAQRPRRARPGTQAPGAEARPAFCPQAAGPDPGDLLGTG